MLRIFVFGLTSALGFVSIASAEVPCNIILLLADDLGWTGPACCGSDLHQTPNIDKLASDGIKFTDAYSACTVCSPTRASIMTGKYPARLHLTDFIAGQNRPFAKLKIPDWNKQLDLDEYTIAEALHDGGYATAHVGKWHLSPRGEDAKQFDPRAQGFDVSISKPPGTRGYFLPDRLRGESKNTYLTDYLTDKTVKIIDGWKDRPFFLYLAYHTPHTPIQAKKDLVEKYSGQVQEDLTHQNATYAAMVHSLDESVGRIVAAVAKAEITSQTIILFTSDNGGLTQRYGKPTGFISNAPLRRGKGSAYEGGVRVPWIVKWPDRINPGSTCNEPICTIDCYPTFLELAGLRRLLKDDTKFDGESIVSILKNPDVVQRGFFERELYWHYPHYHAGGDGPYGAIRSGRWRLIESYEEMSVELYDLDRDLGESNNLAEKMPEKAKELRTKLHAWRKNIGAQMPSVNPNFNKDKAKRT